MTNTEACIALNMIPQMGPVRFRKLLAVFGEPAGILRAPADRLDAVDGISLELARRVAHWQEHVDLPAELERMKAAGVHALTQQCEAYPRMLREIYDPPIVLYVWGTLTAKDGHAIGVVGCRRPSHYGAESAKKLSYQLAYAGLTVVSGLARGIDTAAHLGALAATNGRTVAVMGGGLSQIYPPENFSLAEKIVTSGAVISEFPMAVKPDKQTFPMRNRIISGCSLGVLVVEAGVTSGALISASQAAEQGRAIFAVPGQIDRPGAIGSNRLIQQGARLVMDGGDILDELGSFFAPSTVSIKEAPPVPRVEMTPVEAAIYAAIDDEETAIDRIIQKCGLPTSQVSSSLFVLEMKKVIKQLPGKCYVKIF